MSKKHVCKQLFYALLAPGLFVCARAGAQVKHQSVSRLASPESQIVAAEVAFQKDELAGNLPALKGVLLPEFVQADRAVLNRDQVLDLVQRAHSLPCRFGMPTIEHPIVTYLDPNIATIAYHSAGTITCGGHVLQAEANVSSLWVNVDGRWKARLRSEIIVSADAK